MGSQAHLGGLLPALRKVEGRRCQQQMAGGWHIASDVLRPAQRSRSARPQASKNRSKPALARKPHLQRRPAAVALNGQVVVVAAAVKGLRGDDAEEAALAPWLAPGVAHNPAGHVRAGAAMGQRLQQRRARHAWGAPSAGAWPWHGAPAQPAGRQRGARRSGLGRRDACGAAVARCFSSLPSPVRAARTTKTTASTDTTVPGPTTDPPVRNAVLLAPAHNRHQVVDAWHLVELGVDAACGGGGRLAGGLGSGAGAAANCAPRQARSRHMHIMHFCSPAQKRATGRRAGQQTRGLYAHSAAAPRCVAIHVRRPPPNPPTPPSGCSTHRCTCPAPRWRRCRS